jgi:hypothetical protein
VIRKMRGNDAYAGEGNITYTGHLIPSPKSQPCQEKTWGIPGGKNSTGKEHAAHRDGESRRAEV